MPYIKAEVRKRINLQLTKVEPETIGELNYTITAVILRYLRREGISYDRLNAILGVLAAIKQEFYRRVVVDFEDMKMEENGDVF